MRISGICKNEKPFDEKTKKRFVSSSESPFAALESKAVFYIKLRNAFGHDTASGKSRTPDQAPDWSRVLLCTFDASL